MANRTELTEEQIKNILFCFNEYKYSLYKICRMYKIGYERLVSILSKDKIIAYNRQKKKNNHKRATISNIKSMVSHMNITEEDVPVLVEWLIKFEDYDKISFLSKSFSINIRKKSELNIDIFRKFIDKFYHDKMFNKLYEQWLISGKNNNLRPSLDHKNPLSMGVDHSELGNIQFITWLENRCKGTNPYSEWLEIKKNIYDYMTPMEDEENAECH